MKKQLKIFLLLVGMIMAGSCATDANKVETNAETNNAEVEKEKPVVVEEPSTNGLGITDVKYAASLKISLLNKGNNYLVKKVLEKLRAGEENVYIAALGGSVTEGAGPSNFKQGYAYQFKNFLTEKYAADANKVFFDGAGIGGTPSPMGLVRYQKDVVDYWGRTPDLLLIEFAVNDWQECSNTRGFEYLIRDALKNGTAVVVVYAAATYGNQQQVMSPVAQFYKVPEVSISNALDYSGINKNKDTNIYYTDMVHPTANGHKFMADCIMNLFEVIDEAEADEPFAIPEGYKNANAFTEFKTVYSNTEDPNVKITAGGFTKKDPLIQNYLKGGKSFPDNWYNDGSSNESFKITLNCKSLIFIYKNSNAKNFGNAEVYVDGKLYKKFNGCDGTGWNNCVVTMIIDEKESAKHTVEVKMAEGEENKAFTILALGYAK